MAEYLIGIDGGGSKTDFLLCDLGLNEVARRVSGRSNPNDIGLDKTAELLKENITAIIVENGIKNEDIAAVFAGIAGASTADFVEKLENAIKTIVPEAKVGVLHDGINVLYGAFPYEDGVSIICGTGSSCFIKKGSQIIRIGGYGAFDLIGNGYEIGRAGLAHALKTVDGREQPGILEELLYERFGTDFLTALDEMLLMTKNELAAFAPTVFKAAKTGDGAALKIITDNMKYIAELINKAGDHFENGYSVALAGGILRDELALDLLRSMINNRVTLVQSDRAPSFGAAARAKQLI